MVTVTGSLLVSCASMSGNSTEYQLIEAEQHLTDKVVGKVKPALVRIQVVEPNYSQGRESKFVASGSGAIITPEGHIVTNHHVAGKAVRLICTMPNREEIPAVLIGTDAATDIAVIKLTPDEPMTFSVAEFGDSDSVKVGDTVFALGSPLGISQSVTRGVMSNTAMVIPQIFRSGGFTLDGENVGELVRWFAHDAEIHGGNSGGPLVNADGEIIGVNEISYGLAGAIPGNLAKKVAFDIIEKSEMDRAYVGMAFQPLLKGSSLDRGVLVGAVLKDSPAEKAGILPGDVLLEIDGESVGAKFYEDIPLINNIIADLPIDGTVSLKVLRDGEQQTLKITPERRLPATPPESESREWGMTLRDLSVFTQLRLARESSTGILVTSASSGGPIAKAKPPIRRGDVITRVNDREVTNVEDFNAITNELMKDQDDLVSTLVEFERDGESFLTVVKVGIDKLDNPGVEVRKAWLPMETQVLTKELADQLGLEGVKGVRVTRVYDEKPEDFPFEVGDIVTRMDGEVIEASQIHDAEVFNILVRQYRIGSKPEFDVLRDGEKLTVSAELASSPKRSREMHRFRDLDFEFVVQEATYQDRQDPKTKDVEVNVLAESVVDGGWASLGGLSVGDVILEIDGKPIESLADVEQIMKDIHESKPRYVIFRVRRGVQNLFLEMEPFW